MIEDADNQEAPEAEVEALQPKLSPPVPSNTLRSAIEQSRELIKESQRILTESRKRVPLKG